MNATLQILFMTAAMVFIGGGCSRKRSAASEAPVMVTVSVKVTNNLDFGIEARAESGGQVVWRDAVSAKSTKESSLGPVALQSMLSFRATDSRGTLISSRDSMRLGSPSITWIIP